MTELDQALVSVREPLQADGADLQLVDFTDGTVALKLVLEGVECAECVLPRDSLETVILHQLRAQVPSVTAVQLEDPRE